MQLTSCEIENNKYIQIYLTEDELEKQETKKLISKYKKEKCSVSIFISGKENYTEIIKKIVINQAKANKNIY